MAGWRRWAGLGVVSAAAACAAASACSASAIGGEATTTSRAPLDITSQGGCAIALTRFDLAQPDGSPRDFIELQVTGASPGATLSSCGLAELDVIDANTAACQKTTTVNVGGTVIPSDGFVEVCDPSARSRCDVPMSAADWMHPGEILDFVDPGGTTVLSGGFGKLTSCGFVVGAPGTTVIGEDEHAGQPDRVMVWCYTTYPSSSKKYWNFAPMNESDAHVATPPGACPVAPPYDAGPGSGGASAGGASSGTGGSGTGGSGNGTGGSSAGNNASGNSSGGCAVGAPGSPSGGGLPALAALMLGMALFGRRRD